MRSVSERIFSRVQSLLQIGRTSTAPNDAGNTQTVQIRTSDMQTRDALQVLYEFGFTACIPVGTDVLVMQVSGDNANGVIVKTSHQPSRPHGLQPGQVMVYDQIGSQLLLDNTGNIIATPKGGILKVVGNAEITGTLKVDADAMIDGRSFIGHEHKGVQTGSGVTGAVV